MNHKRISAGASKLGGQRSRLHRAAATLGALAFLVSGSIIATPNSASAVDWPTWADVAAARNNETATAAAVAHIESLLGGLRAEAERTQADAQVKGNAYGIADQNFQDAAHRAAELQEQADAARAVAAASEQRAGQMAAQLVRSGDGNNIAATLFAQAGEADGLLYGLEMAGKVSEQIAKIRDQAVQDRNSAQAQTDAADEAKRILEELRIIAEKAFQEAQAASILAADALAAEEAHRNELAAQLIVLKENRAATEADYLKGVQERFNSGASLDAGEISLTGWARPASGYISSSYGWRVNPVSGAWAFHAGTDIAASCGQNMYAASSGTVVYAGWNSGYGNFIQIDHGNGISTAYGHILNGGILVSIGQNIGVGTHIAEVGSTGNSTGCHLHFEVRQNNVAIDNVSFMANQGIRLGTVG